MSLDRISKEKAFISELMEYTSRSVAGDVDKQQRRIELLEDLLYSIYRQVCVGRGVLPKHSDNGLYFLTEPQMREAFIGCHARLQKNYSERTGE